jgi:acyl transferase domain-containing protein
MVLPGDELSVKLSHVAMNAGLKVIKVETFNQRDEKVLEGTAEVMQPPTTYVFTGQGSQEQGMGMELYNSSPAAKAVWDAADQHLLKTYVSPQRASPLFLFDAEFLDALAGILHHRYRQEQPQGVHCLLRRLVPAPSSILLFSSTRRN